MDQREHLAKVEGVAIVEATTVNRWYGTIPQAALDSWERMRALVAAGMEEGDIELILETERILLEKELERMPNSLEREASLGTALRDLDAALEAFQKLRDDPIAYKALDRDHSLPKNRIGDVPDDQARQFFRSHRTRLKNFRTGRMTSHEEEKAYKARSRAIGIAERLYDARQREVLGIAPKGSPHPNRR